MPFTMKNENFSPDYYLLTPHGVGALSFSYYLALIGAPCADVNGSVYKNGKKIPLCYPNQKSTNIYELGVSCDRVFLNSQPLSYGNNTQYIIQLIRDPIEQITSIMNWFIADNVFGRGTNYIVLDYAQKLNFISTYIPMSCMYSSLRASIKSSSNTFYVDTSDLKPDTCINSMENIAKYLNIPFVYESKKPFEISYNSFENRAWLYQNSKSIAITVSDGDEYIGGIRVLPEHLYDYGANFWTYSHILGNFSYNDHNYIVSMLTSDYYRRGDISKNKLWNNNYIDAVKISIDIFLAHREIASLLYKKLAMTPEKTIALIRSKPRFYSRFMRTMERELSIVKREAPEKVENWRYFNSL